MTRKTAWHLAHRIRETWSERAGPFGGPVEIDEVCIGGKERNRHACKKLRAGRGTAGKVPAAGIKDRESDRVTAAPMARTSQKAVGEMVAGAVRPGSAVCTDESALYGKIPRREAVNHSAGECVRGAVHANGIESFRSMLRRGCYGTCRKMSAKHLRRYVNEFAGRHSARDLDTIRPMAAVVHAMHGKRLRYKDLAGAEAAEGGGDGPVGASGSGPPAAESA